MNLSVKVTEILNLFPDAEISGSCEIEKIDGLANLREAKIGELSFLGNPKYKAQVKSCKASIILLPLEYSEEPQENQLFIRIAKPSLGLAQVCGLLESRLYSTSKPGIHPTAFVEGDAVVGSNVTVGAFTYISSGAQVGNNCQINSHCHIGNGSVVGDGSILHPGVNLLSRCVIGEKVVLNAGVVIGSEGYGFDRDEEGHQKIPHLGIVVIEDGVEIGANTCIDRARFEETKIGQGSKLDNLVQVGHNVKIGNNCLIVAQVGISGSVTMEDDVIVGGQAGFAGHLKVGKGAKIAGQAGITKDVEAGAFLKGNPALPFHLAQRIAVLQRKLPDLFNRFAQEKSKD